MNEFSTRIRQDMAVVGSDGAPVGTVDTVDGEQIRLACDGGTPQHRIPVSTIDAIEGNEVRLTLPGAAARAMAAATDTPPASFAGLAS